MKKVFLVIAVTLFSLNCIGQEKINTDDLIGYWEPNKNATQLFFWKDANNILQTQEISIISGEPLDVMSIRLEKQSIVIKTIFVKNKWIVESRYSFIDKHTIICTVTGDSDDTIIYKKIK